MHLMICSLPSSFNNAFVCRKIYANGVRAEPMKKANENRFFMAHVPLSLSQMLVRVDVPRFELGNRNAERIRCFILGFQVAQRLAAWQNTRYGGGL